MTMLSDRMHWLAAGLALIVSAHGWINPETVHGQTMVPTANYGAPNGLPPGVIQAGGMMPDAPMSMAFQGPPPMDVMFAGANGSCDSSCDTMGGCSGCGGCNSCGGSVCGGDGCGAAGGIGGRRGAKGSGGILGGGRRGNGGGGGILGLLGGSGAGGAAASAQRWFDVYAGTIALQRTSSVGGIATAFQNPQTGAFATTDLISTFGTTAAMPALSVGDVDLDRLRFGLEIVAALQTGVGSNLEVRYFGLNNWNETATANTIASGVPTLFSVFSLYGTNPGGMTPGFDDTDRSFIHSISYNSELHNGEVNYRRRWVSAFDVAQGSWLFGIRHFDLDERFGFNATGSNDNTFTFNQLRFFDYTTETRNQLTGVQLGGDLWANISSGLHIGVEGKGGIYGNHAEVESNIIANSVAGAREHLQEGRTAYLFEASAQAVLQLSHSCALRGAYNVLYVDNVALAPENFNTRDFNNAIGNGVFTLNRFPFLNVDGEVFYQGFSTGLEWTY